MDKAFELKLEEALKAVQADFISTEFNATMQRVASQMTLVAKEDMTEAILICVAHTIFYTRLLAGRSNSNREYLTEINEFCRMIVKDSKEFIENNEHTEEMRKIYRETNSLG